MATLAGLTLLLPIGRDEVRVVLCGFFGGLVSVPALATPWPWIPLAIAAGLRIDHRYRPRMVAAGGAAVLAMVVFPFLGNTTLGEIGVVGLGGLLFGLGAPLERVAGVPMALISGFAAAQGFQLGLDARTMPIERIAPIAAARGAERLRPILAARAAKSLAAGDHADAVHVIKAFPSAQNLGEKLAKDLGVDFAIDLGWLPLEPVDPEIAVEVSWALHDAGHHRASLAVLGESSGLDFQRAILRAEQGGEPSMPNSIPEQVLRVPGVVIDREEILENESIQVFLAVETQASRLVLEATGQPFLGPPELVLSLAGSELGRVKVEEDRGEWTFERPMKRGVYRLVLSYENDHHGDNGDRNLYGVRVRVE